MEKYDDESMLEVRLVLDRARADVLQDTPLTLWSVPFLCNLANERELTQLVYILELYREARIALPGEPIFLEGDLDTRFYVVVFGSISVQKNEQYIYTLSSGDFFGECCALGLAKERTSTIICESLCALAIIPGDVLKRALEDLPECRSAFYALCTQSRAGTGWKVCP